MPSAVEPSPGDVREELCAICAHKRFARSERLSQFLRFIVEQKLLGNVVNEQLIGINVFGRQPGYDSGKDTIVRTQAVELRKRLEEYYRDNRDARVRISVLKGNYNPTFAWLYQEPGNPAVSDPLVFPDIPDIVAPGLVQGYDESRETASETPVKEPGVALQPVHLPDRRRHFAPRWKIGVVAICSLLAAILALILWRPQRNTPLAGNHTIVLAEFSNTTGESVFDGTLKQALRIELEQSPFLNVLSDARVAATLKLMARPTTERVTEQVAQEVCQRTNSEALLVGSIARVGNPYLITLRVANCQSGDTLASTEAQAPNRDRVLRALQQAANQLRRKLGESLASLGKFDKPLDEATTSSLEALKTISDAMRIRTEGGFIDITPYFKRAIDLDPNFALAYAALGTYYANAGEGDLAQLYLGRAFELRGRASERERLFIEGAYYEHITGDLGKSIQTYTEYANVYPLVVQPRVNLGNAYLMLGKYEESATHSLEAIRLNPDMGVAYSNLVCAYLAMDRLDEAKAIYDRALARKLGSFWLRQARYGLAFVQADEAGMQEQVRWGVGKIGVQDFFLSAQSDTEAYYGRLSKARQLSAEAVNSAKRSNSKETAALWEVNAALREAEFGNAVRAKQHAKEALAMSASRDIEVLAGLALARGGDSESPRRIIDKLNRRFPVHSLLQHYWFPTIRASLALNTRNPERAIDILQNETAYELGQSPAFQLGPMYPVYVRGVAYLKAKQGQAAAVQFSDILQHRGIVINFPLGALAHVQLARALALTGNKEEARKEYENFFALWKDADPDIPILQQAKQEYAKVEPR